MIFICDNHDHLRNQRSIFQLILNGYSTKFRVVGQFEIKIRFITPTLICLTFEKVKVLSWLREED